MFPHTVTSLGLLSPKQDLNPSFLKVHPYHSSSEEVEARELHTPFATWKKYSHWDISGPWLAHQLTLDHTDTEKAEEGSISENIHIQPARVPRVYVLESMHMEEKHR